MVNFKKGTIISFETITDMGILFTGALCSEVMSLYNMSTGKAIVKALLLIPVIKMILRIMIFRLIVLPFNIAGFIFTDLLFRIKVYVHYKVTLE